MGIEDVPSQSERKLYESISTQNISSTSDLARGVISFKTLGQLKEWIYSSYARSHEFQTLTDKHSPTFEHTKPLS